MTVQVGQIWKDKRVGRPPYDNLRRLAEVIRIEDRYVYVLGRYEKRTEKGWKDRPWVGSKRHSRVLIAGFVRTHELIEDESAITSRREAAS